MIKEFREIVLFVGTNLYKLNLEILEASLTHQLTFDFCNSSQGHLLMRNQNVHHFGDGPNRRAELQILQLGKNGQRLADKFVLGFFRSVGREIRNKNIAVQIDALHFFFARKFTTTLFSAVLNALKETVLPVLVLNRTVAGLFTVLVATNEAFCRAI